MYSLYSFLLTIGFILLLPRFILDAIRNGKYITGLGQRLGNTPPVSFDDQPVIWLHCVSVGEAQAARSLVRALVEKFSARIVISTTTVTGQKVAREAFAAEAAAVFYFPIDWAWTVRRALRAMKPSVVIVMETELWPNLLRQCRWRGIPVALVNGRISDRSFSRYKSVRVFLRHVLRDLAIALMQSEQDAGRIRKLGLPSDRVVVSGNLKFDSSEIAASSTVTEGLHQRFDFQNGKTLIIAASTHAPEERIALEAFKQLRGKHPQARLLIAPRHPERFAEVEGLIRQTNLSWSKRSDAPANSDQTSQVILLDSVGELRTIYPLADLVFVGGSISRNGGHNMLEPASLGICVITGQHTENFAAITKALVRERAIVQLAEVPELESAQQLAEKFAELISDSKARNEIGKRALEVCRSNRGATERTIKELAAVLTDKQNQVPFTEFHVSAAK